jgi:hypothetical protein
MKPISFLTCILILVSCSKKQSTTEQTKAEIDTLYSAQLKNTPNYSPITIFLSEPDTSSATEFTVGEKSNLQIKFNRLNRYPIELRNLKNVELISSDSTDGIFGLTPEDTTFYFELWMNFGINNAVFKKRDSTIHPAKGFVMISNHKLQAK